MTDLTADVALAHRLAAATGEILLAVRAAGCFEGKALGDAGDAIAQAFLGRALAQARPDDGVLSEEARSDDSRLQRARTWVIDPLDGTREYSEGRDDWAVHVALSVDGHPAAGAVALPGLGIVLDSLAPPTMALCGARPRMLVSRSRPGADSVAVAALIGADLLAMGSAGAKAMAVVRGEAEIYLHSGGQYEWDSCAPAAVAIAAGLHVSRADGSPLVYNCADPYLPDLLICRPEWADRVLGEVRKLAARAQ